MTKRVNKVTGAEYLRGNVVPISQPNESSSPCSTPQWEEPLTGFRSYQYVHRFIPPNF